MALRSLNSDVKGTGVDQGNLVLLLQNIVDMVNELRADHAVVKTFIDELATDNDAGRADLIAIRAAIVGITAKLDADGGITGTDYASIHDPAALTITAIAATAVSTLTNNSDVVLTS